MACEGVVVFDERGEFVLATECGLGIEVGAQKGLNLFLEGFLLGKGVVFAFANSLECGPEERGPFGGSSHSHGSEEDGGLRAQERCEMLFEGKLSVFLSEGGVLLEYFLGGGLLSPEKIDEVRGDAQGSANGCEVRVSGGFEGEGWCFVSKETVEEVVLKGVSGGLIFLFLKQGKVAKLGGDPLLEQLRLKPRGELWGP